MLGTVLSRWMLAILLAVVLLSAEFQGCLVGDDCDDGPECSPLTPKLAPPALETVPDTLIVGSNRFVLGAGVWRNFEPSSDNCPRRLNVFVQVTEVDSMPIPSGMTANHVWVLNGDVFWNARFTSQVLPYTPPYQIEKMARCGPQWTPGAEVDVIVRVRDASGSEAYVRRLGAIIEAPE